MTTGKSVSVLQVKIPPAFLKQLKMSALEADVSLSAYVVGILESACGLSETPGKPRKTRALRSDEAHA
jgi:hypothetical protein